MRTAFSRVWQSPYVQVAVYLLAIYSIFELITRARDVWVTIGFALAFAYVLYPVVRWLERHKLPRILSVALVYLAMLLFLALASVLLAEVVVQLSRLSGRLPELLDPLVRWFQSLPGRISHITVPSGFQAILQQSSVSLQSLLQGYADTLLTWLQSLLAKGGNLIGFLSSLLGGIFQLLMSVVISAYLLYDFPRFGRSLKRALPLPYQDPLHELARRFDQAVGGYIRGQLMVAALVGLVVGAGLAIVGVPMAWGLGFLAGLFNFIPFVGVIISSIPALLLATSLGWVNVLLTLGVLVLANQLEAHLFGPLILARATAIHPLTAIISILLGASLFGILGALAAVPTAAFLKMIYTDYYLESRFHREG